MVDAPVPAKGDSADAAGQPRRARLRADFHAQTARIAFTELQRFFAAGRLVCVAPDLDLVEVAVELACDNRGRLEHWLADGAVEAVSDARAREWLGHDARLWAVVAEPWVLVQEVGEPAGGATESP